MKNVIVIAPDKLDKIFGDCKRAQAYVAIAAFHDCNKFCKVKTGRLRNSARVNLLTGELIWDTPYAKRAYYLGTPDKSVNPNASLMWAAKAAQLNSERWRRIVEKELK